VVDCDQKEALSGAIVCIPNADPGFDWLFAYPIAGLITAWGGANSHMAIRAGELGLPAVIGAGEALYQRWAKAKRLYVDCAGKRVEVLA
jgi:phosphoenolpyruvate-protein kinase (PTS system EI component)